MLHRAYILSVHLREKLAILLKMVICYRDDCSAILEISLLHMKPLHSTLIAGYTGMAFSYF